MLIQKSSPQTPYSVNTRSHKRQPDMGSSLNFDVSFLCANLQSIYITGSEKSTLPSRWWNQMWAEAGVRCHLRFEHARSTMNRRGGGVVQCSPFVA